FNSSSPASFHFLATPPHLLSPHNFIEGAVRKPRPEQSCTQSGQRRVTARSALSELCPTYDPPMVPPGAERAARGVPSELRLNLELNIGPLPHPWPFAPRFLRAKSRTQTKCLHLTCWHITMTRATSADGMKAAQLLATHSCSPLTAAQLLAAHSCSPLTAAQLLAAQLLSCSPLSCSAARRSAARHSQLLSCSPLTAAQLLATHSCSAARHSQLLATHSCSPLTAAQLLATHSCSAARHSQLLSCSPLTAAQLLATHSCSATPVDGRCRSLGGEGQ
ncbi:hypothetical protein KUCAC02_028801, partial [Chaenocephalus aceratus]